MTSATTTPTSTYARYTKRALGVLIAVLIVIFLWWLMLIAAIAIKLESRGPALFKQERLGLNGKIFIMYKFRSMAVNSEHTGSGVYSGLGDTRVTRVGKILRATSIDELPQVFNILKGDMSFIGPRPPLTYHPWPLENYTAYQRRMFDVRPGLTGWAQIHGRRTVEWNQRIDYNIYYVDHVSFALDWHIFVKSFAKVFTAKDNENTTATVDKTTANQPTTDTSTTA